MIRPIVASATNRASRRFFLLLVVDECRGSVDRAGSQPAASTDPTQPTAQAGRSIPVAPTPRPSINLAHPFPCPRTYQVGWVQKGGGLAVATSVGMVAFSSAMMTVEWGDERGSRKGTPLQIQDSRRPPS